MIKILTFSTLYPNDQQTTHGVFVENRLQHLLASGAVQSRVVAPIPWFPFKSERFGAHAAFARACRSQTRKGVEILHPRYPIIPKIGMTATPLLMYLSMRKVIRRILDDGYDFDLLDAHYFYPDGVAAALLAREFNKPLTITARGTDLNLIPQYKLPRKQIKWAADRADGIITVCAALAEPLVEMGVPREKVTVLRNGVDLENFIPLDREESRKALDIAGPTAVSVGWLIERKGHHIAIGMLPHQPDLTLLIAGEGPERPALEALAAKLNVADRVRFLGHVPHNELARIYSAVDFMLLCSSREGWANVLLESMACGTPVVATDIWGTGEVVAAPEAGVLIPERTSQSLSDGIDRLMADMPDRRKTRAYAEGFSWDDTTQGQIDLFGKILNGRKA